LKAAQIIKKIILQKSGV